MNSPSRTHIILNDANNPSNGGGSPVFSLAAFDPPPLRCWAFGAPVAGAAHGAITGASLTVVRLDTGEVLAHFMGQDSLHTAPARTTNLFTGEAFTAPMTGTPAVYPADTGQVAQRVYVGDADGQLWRFDLSSATPSNWTAQLAWDAYLDYNGSYRDGIQTPPLLSRDPMGNTVIVFGTGEQNMLTVGSTNNRLWSITETPACNPFPSCNFTSQNWVVKYAPDQGHVVGQMALFNDVLYFSTYQPLGGTPSNNPNPSPGCSNIPPGKACNPGNANLGAADYRRPLDATGVPIPRWGTPPALYSGASTTDGSVIFGVSATELPSCGGTSPSSDPYFGSHQQVTALNASEYRIMWQTGSGAGLAGASGAKAEGGITGVQNITIPPPGQSTRIDSWGTIVE